MISTFLLVTTLILHPRSCHEYRLCPQATTAFHTCFFYKVDQFSHNDTSMNHFVSKNQSSPPKKKDTQLLSYPEINQISKNPHRFPPTKGDVKMISTAFGRSCCSRYCNRVAATDGSPAALSWLWSPKVVRRPRCGTHDSNGSWYSIMQPKFLRILRVNTRTWGISQKIRKPRFLIEDLGCWFLAMLNPYLTRTQPVLSRTEPVLTRT